MANIDSLNIRISADAGNASRSIDTLCSKLNILSSALSSINASGLNSLSQGVQNLASSMNMISGSANSAESFSLLARNIKKLGRIDAGALSNAGAAVTTFANSLQSLNNIQLTDTATNVTSLAKAISKLGNANVQRAVQNMPILANSFVGLMTTLSSAPAVSSGVISLANSMAQLSRSGAKVQVATGEMAPSFHSAGLSIKSLKPHITSLAAAFGKFYASCFLVIRGIKGLWSAIKSSMDYVEVYNYFNAAMEQIVENADLSKFEELGFESAQAYAESFGSALLSLQEKMTGYTVNSAGMLVAMTSSKNLGLNATDLMNASTGFAQIASSMGVASKNATKMAVVLTELGADLASVKNMEFEDVWTSLQSGVVGMSRAVDKYGVNIRAANLQTKLTNLGISTTIDKLGQEEKALLRVITMLDSTKYAWGDLADTIDQPANRLRVLNAAWQNLCRTIGNIFLPVVAKVIPYITSLVVALQRLAEWIVKLLGFEDFEWGTGSDSGISDLISDINDGEDSLDDATDSAKKFKKALQGFDELNNLTTKDDTSSSTGISLAELATLNAAFDEAVENYQKRWDKAFAEMSQTYEKFANDVANAFKSSGLYGVGKFFAESIANSLRKIPWSSIYQKAKDFGTGFAKFLNGLITPDLFSAVAETIAGALNTKLYAALSFAERFDWTNFGNSLASGVSTFFRDYDFASLGHSISVFAKGLLDTLIAFLDKTDWSAVGKGIGDFLANIEWASVLGKVAIAIYKALSGLMDVYVGSFSASPIATSLLTIGGSLAALKVGPKYVTALGNAFKSLVSPLTKVGKLANTFGNGIIAAADNGLDGAKALAGGFNNVSASLSPLTKVLGSAAVSIAEFFAVKDGFKDMINGSRSLASCIGEITVAAGVASAALALILGVPTGLIVAGCVAGVAAIAGINEAFKELDTEQYGANIHNAFFNPGGTPLEEVSLAYSNLASGISDSFGTISEAASGLDSARSSVSELGEGIEKVLLRLENGVGDTEENVTQIVSQFQRLLDESSTIFSQEEDVILAGISGPLAAAMEAAGMSVDEIVAALKGTEEGYANEVESIKAELTDLEQKYSEGKISLEEYSSKVAELYKNYAEVTGYVDDSTQAVNDFNTALSNIDLSNLFGEDGSINTEMLDGVLNSVVDNANNAKDSVVASSEEMTKALDAMIEKATRQGDTEAVSVYTALKSANETACADAIKQIEQSAVDFTDAIQTNIVDKMDDVAERAAKDWEEKPLLARLWSSATTGVDTSDEYAAEVTDKFRQSLGTVSSSIEETLDKLGVDGSVWMTDAMSNIYSGMFDTSVYGGTVITKMSDDLEGVVKSGIEAAKPNVESDMSAFGSTTVTSYIDGLKIKQKDGKDAMSEFAASLDSAFHDGALQFGSPSKKMNQYGQWTVEGFANGIDENTSVAITSFEAFFGSLISTSDKKIGEFINSSVSSMQKWRKSMLSVMEEWKSDFTKIVRSVTVGTGADLDAWQKKIAGIFTVDGWNLSDISTKLSAAFSVALDAVKNSWKEFAEWFNKSFKIEVDDSTDYGKAVADKLGSKSVQVAKIPAYSGGGIVEDGLFFANHNELVGRFSNGRTAVANNQQIIEGIKQGVYEAVATAMIQGGNGETTVNVELVGDAAGVFRLVRQQDKEYRKTTGRSAFI